MKQFILSCVGLTFLLNTALAWAHEGTPNMAFLWRDGNIEIDTARQGIALGDYTAFVIPFTDSFLPHNMDDAGFTGANFDQGGFASYQIESTLLKWSEEQSQWLGKGFKEQIVIKRLSEGITVTDTDGNGSQGFIASLARSTGFQAHPSFKMTTADGSLPDDGAYMMFISISGVDETAERIVYKPSAPFALIFHINAQANFDQLALAEALKVVPDVQLNDYTRMDGLFDWAESEFATVFPHHIESRFIQGYYARCYENANCVGSKGNDIYTVGGVFGELVNHGPIETFYNAAGL